MKLRDQLSHMRSDNDNKGYQYIRNRIVEYANNNPSEGLMKIELDEVYESVMDMLLDDGLDVQLVKHRNRYVDEEFWLVEW